jgi:zinc D-Ala-D-Ala carboxypeptidase
MQLSKNFSLVELTKSQTAERKGISNDPSPDHLENLRLLCERVLQPVRDHFNHVVSVSSGYRSPQLSQAIGSSPDSQHCQGMAADFEIYGTPNNEVFNWIKANLMYDQMILEYWNPDEPNSGWVHVAYNPDSSENIKQNLRAYKDEDNKTQYKPMLGDA